jgi:hypothetical protein
MDMPTEQAEIYVCPWCEVESFWVVIDGNGHRCETCGYADGPIDDEDEEDDEDWD